MKYPNLKEERKLWRKGYKKVVGLDEAGRGCLAGPVVAVAVVIKSKVKSQKSKVQLKSQKSFEELRDSKKLTAKKREELYNLIIKNSNIEWGIGRVSEKVIDKINILEATKLAMERAIKKLKAKSPRRRTFGSLRGRQKSKVDFLILDGNFKINSSIPQKSIVKADEKVFSCAVASIIAKVTRDRIIKRYHQEYPQYGFNRHKGYPTKFHRRMLKKYGPCEIHRMSFGPIAKMKNVKMKNEKLQYKI